MITFPTGCRFDLILKQLIIVFTYNLSFLTHRNATPFQRETMWKTHMDN